METARKIRLGIIGCGNVTEHHHLPALRHVRRVEVVALADLDSVRVERLARRFNIPGRYTSHADLLEAGKVDAVAVCVPPQLHTEMALAALSHGKHVFIEKPLALCLAECDTLADHANANSSLKVMVGFNLRWHRLIRQAREILVTGELGDIKLVRTVFTSGGRRRQDCANWRSHRETGGGALFDLGVHHFDLLRFLLRSEANEVHSFGMSADETATVMMRMSNGAQAVCAFSQGTGESHAIEVYGERGWLRIGCYRSDGLERFSLRQYPGAVSSRLRRFGQTLSNLPRIVQQTWRGGDYAASYAEEWKHFIRAVTHDAPVECTLLDGRRSLEIALAACESNSTGRVCRLQNPAS